MFGLYRQPYIEKTVDMHELICLNTFSESASCLNYEKYVMHVHTLYICIYTYVCIYIYTHICIHTHTSIHPHGCVLTYLYLYHSLNYILSLRIYIYSFNIFLFSQNHNWITYSSSDCCHWNIDSTNTITKYRTWVCLIKFLALK